jgi:hypothetical protein
MNEDALIRLSNLKALGLTAKLLEQQVGGRYTYWRDLLAGQKSFGEKIARKIEEAMEYPRGYLDQVIDKPADDWPFQTLTPAQLRNLPMAYLEAIERHALDLVALAKTPTDGKKEHPDTVGDNQDEHLTVLTGQIPSMSGHQSAATSTHTKLGPSQRGKRVQGNS